MVLESLLPEKWLEKKARYAFFIAVLFSSIGILVSRMLFGANSGIVSVFFTSMLFLPYLRRLLRKEEKIQDKGGYRKELISDNFTTFKVYLFVFLGICFTYAIYTFLMPLYGIDPTPFFREQLILDRNLSGGALSIEFFATVLTHNWWVLFACFVLSLLIGDGAIFFVAWNASSWGTLIGFRAVSAALVSGNNPLWFLVLLAGITFPHLVLEGSAYILASISGGVISEEVIHTSKQIKYFLTHILVGIISFLVIYYAYLHFLPEVGLLMLTAISAATMLAILYSAGRVFEDIQRKETFVYHYRLFLFAAVLLILAAVMESYVLSSSFILREIYSLSQLYR
jgi:uncharacterized membrane protein SpoIIM required for sporulation